MNWLRLFKSAFIVVIVVLIVGIVKAASILMASLLVNEFGFGISLIIVFVSLLVLGTVIIYKLKDV